MMSGSPEKKKPTADKAAPPWGGFVVSATIISLIGVICSLLGAYLVAMNTNTNAVRQELTKVTDGLRQENEALRKENEATTRRLDRIIDRLDTQAMNETEQLCHAAKGQYDANRALCIFADGHPPHVFRPLEK